MKSIHGKILENIHGEALKINRFEETSLWGIEHLLIIYIECNVNNLFLSMIANHEYTHVPTLRMLGEEWGTALGRRKERGGKNKGCRRGCDQGRSGEGVEIRQHSVLVKTYYTNTQCISK